MVDATTIVSAIAVAVMKSNILAETLVVLLILGGTFAVYWQMSGDYQRNKREYRSTVLNVDAFAVMRVLCDEKFVAKYHRTTVHPLFAIFFKPFGSRLASQIGAPNAARTLNTSIAAIGIVLFYWFLRMTGLSRLHSGLGAGILAGTASHVVYGAIPETYAFASASLILLALIFVLVQNERMFQIAMIPASVFSMGITLTNFVFAAILFCARFLKRTSKIKQLYYFTTFCMIVAGLFLALLFLQKWVYPNTRDFFSKHLYESNRAFLSAAILETPFVRIANRTPHLFLHNVVAPGIVRHRPAFPATSELSTLTLVTFIVYGCVLLFSIYLIARFRLYRTRIFLALLVYFLFQWIFFLIYGDEPHLYTSHYTFALIALMAFPFAAQNRLPPKMIHGLTAMCAVLLPLLFANNILFLRMVVRLP